MVSFQSTRPARGATAPGALVPEGPFVSIHAPRTGRDPLSTSRQLLPMSFQSTRPARGATGLVVDDVRYLLVSIHAPRTGRDSPVSP